MRNLSLLLTILLLAALTVSAKNKTEMPAVITNATYVMVTTYDGGPLNPELTPEDRGAVADTQQAIEKWGRYKLVYNLKEADLILVVRTGRTGQMGGTVRRSTSVGPGAQPGGSALGIGAEAGDPEDSLSVYSVTQDLKSAPPLWRSRAVDGLKGPQSPLMEEFQSKVEVSAKKNP